MHNLKRILIFTFLWTFVMSNFSQEQFTTGPEKGYLIVVGGGNLNDSGIYQKMIEIMGGPDKLLVVIPTASDDRSLERENYYTNTEKRYNDIGFKNVKIIHTRDVQEANAEEFIKPIKKASGVWFPGGRQWRLADSYLNTKTHDELNNLLERGGIIGGSSAGATIQGSYLARGDSKTNTIMMGDHEVGLGFISNIAIDQHVMARNRQFDMFEILDKRPELLGIGLDESTAIFVHGDEFEVIGKHYVAIYDGRFRSTERRIYSENSMDEKKFYFLKKGQKYNMRDRKVVEGQ